MRVSAQAFWSPKAGNRITEFEDAFWPKHKVVSRINQKFRFAVADGATETSFSGIWAKQLVRAFGKGELQTTEMAQSLPVLREKWHENVTKIVSRKPLPWYVEQKIRSGAFASILGIVLTNAAKGEEGGSWNAFAIGDSCVIQFRGIDLVTSFPIRSADQFNNSPALFSSRSVQREHDDVQLVLTKEGMWHRGDSFYLMTDAIACWLLRQIEEGHTPAKELADLSVSGGEHFQTWLDAIRARRAIRNDDVTMLSVQIEQI